MLKLVTPLQQSKHRLKTGGVTAADAQSLDDHRALIDGFLQSHRIRNHQEGTILQYRQLLLSWFEQHGPSGNTGRPLYTWEAMCPVSGRNRVVDYGKALLAIDISPNTIRGYLGRLSRYFSYVLEQPYLFSQAGHCRIQDRYGPIEQPVSEYDKPSHSRDDESRGIPMEPERLYDFFAVVRKTYLVNHSSSFRARNYALAVLAGETGLRSDELLNLEVSDPWRVIRFGIT
jgi:integrase